MIFADPPYFLSNGGISYQAGKVVCVDKGEWDKGGSPESIMEFNRTWLSLCREKLKDNGTIWISGTHHNIFSIANVLTELGYKILNVITWWKNRSRLGQCAGADWDTFDAAKLMIFSETVAF